MCRNRVVHILFVPCLFWSFMAAIAKVPMVMLLDRFPFNLSFAITTLYICYYLLLEPVAGALFAPLLLTMTYSANVFALKSDAYCWPVIGLVQLVSWVAQFSSHALFEKRSPALLDNLAQALLLAPLFVFMELLFVLGYRPALYKRTREKTKAAIVTWKLSRERRHSD